MKKIFLRSMMPMLCLCLLWGMGITSSASATQATFNITISPPATQSAPVIIQLENAGDVRFVSAHTKLSGDEAWQDITGSLRESGRAHFVASRSGRVYISIVDNEGNAHVRSRHIEIIGGGVPPALPTQPEQQPEPPAPPMPPEQQPAPPAQPSVPEVPASPEETGPPTGGSIIPVDGTGTVIENSILSPDSREFFTVTTERGGVFFLVVDRDRPDANVYLLSEVTEEDLAGFTRLPPAPEPEPLPPPPPVIPTPPEPEEAPPANLPASQPSSSSGMLIVVIVALAVGGIAYYFKIARRKQITADSDEDEGDYSGMAEEPDDEENYWDFPEHYGYDEHDSRPDVDNQSGGSDENAKEDEG